MSWKFWAPFAVAFGLLEGRSSEDEDDLFSSDEEGGHNVDKVQIRCRLFVLLWPACLRLQTDRQTLLQRNRVTRVSI